MTRVLVVDDSQDFQDLLHMVLADEGFDVASALEGGRGLQLVRELQPDVILLDMMMPEVDGLEFLSRLSDLRPAPPVVGLSGFDGFRAEALHRGAVAFLVKPVSTETLLGALRSALERRPIEPSLLAENVAGLEPARRVAGEQSGRALARLREVDMSELRQGLRRVTRWMPTYFGFGMSIVALLRGNEVSIEAVHNGPERIHEGQQVARADVYCGDVIAAGSTLVLPDPEHHPCEHFARHKEMREGWRFYAGVALTSPSGAVMGSLCLRDTIARAFRSEDMRVLEALGRAVARGLETKDWPLDEDGAFARRYQALFLDVVMARATRAGGAGVITTVESCSPTPEATGLAVVRLDRARSTLLWGGPLSTIPATVSGSLRPSS
jgi:CheY-like chemotaxis protein